MARLSIIIDTREQTPWAFDPACVDAEIGTLQTGDYALAGDSSFGIERKSMNDFLATISTGWDRFERELERMAEWVGKVMIVEGDYSTCFFAQTPNGELVSPQHPHYMLTPQFVEMRVAYLTLYYGVSVLFAGDANLAAGLAVAIFRQRNKQIIQQKELSEPSEI
jgi:ERCC4-type nuclease